MRAINLGCGVLAATLAGSAAADFLGWAANVSQQGDYGIMDVYAMFDDSGDAMFGVLELYLEPAGFAMFHQDNLFAPAWAPQYSFSADSIDSYLTIGDHAVPLSNPTAPVPDFLNWFGPEAVLPPYSVPGPGSPVGWTNQLHSTTPIYPAAVVPNLNETGSSLGVLVGRFAILNPADDIRREFRFDGRAHWDDTLRFAYDEKTFAYLPTPGGIAVVVLAGLVGRRRRA